VKTLDHTSFFEKRTLGKNEGQLEAYIQNVQQQAITIKVIC
jgi:hypothetical protein